MDVAAAKGYSNMTRSFIGWSLAAALIAGGAAAQDLGTLMKDDKQWVMPAKNYAKIGRAHV